MSRLFGTLKHSFLVSKSLNCFTLCLSVMQNVVLLDRKPVQLWQISYEETCCMLTFRWSLVLCSVLFTSPVRHLFKMAQKLEKEIESKPQQALFHLLLDLLQNKSLWYTVAWQILFVNSLNAMSDNWGWEDLNFKNVMLGHFDLLFTGNYTFSLLWHGNIRSRIILSFHRGKKRFSLMYEHTH